MQRNPNNDDDDSAVSIAGMGVSLFFCFLWSRLLGNIEKKFYSKNNLFSDLYFFFCCSRTQHANIDHRSTEELTPADR